MPYEFYFDSSHDVLFVTSTEITTDEEYLNAFNQIIQTPGFHPGANLLADFTKSENTVSTDAVIKSLHLMELYKDKFGNGKWASVVSNITHYGLGSMFSMLIGKLPVESRIFRKMRHARQWLSLPPLD